MKFITRSYMTASEPVYSDLPRKIDILSRDAGQVSGHQIFNRYPAGYQTVLQNIRPDIQSDLARYPVRFKAYWPDIQQINRKSNLISSKFLLSFSQNYLDFGDQPK